MKKPVSSKQRFRALRVKPSDKGSAPSSSTDTAAGADAGKPAKRKYLKDYVRWLWPYRAALLLLFILATLGAALDLVWPLAIKQVIDLLSGPSGVSSKLRLLHLYGLAIIGLLVVKQAVDSFRSYRTSLLNTKLIFRLRKRLYDRLLNLGLGGLSEMKAGGIVSRLSSDVDSVSGLVQMAVISPAVAFIRVALTISILMWKSPKLALAGLAILPPLALVSFIWLRKVRPIYRSMREDRSTIDARVTETFGGIRVVRSFRREQREELNYALGHHTVMRKSLRAEWMELALAAAWGLMVPGISVLVVWVGGLLVLRNEATMGDLFLFQIYAVLLIQPVWAIVGSVSSTQKSLAAMERVFEVLEMPPDKPDAPDAVDAPAQVKEFRFDRVNFEYRKDIPVVKDFDLVVPGGATVALVGPSGAGKTTITDLVARFHDPTAGSIKLNGIDLRKIKLASYRQLIAVVQQEVFLFDGTASENIAYGLRGATEEQIIDAARRANAHEFITAMPEGYDTLIGERGYKLSGGQRQRISIARAILANPQILILDEATSNLDTESEQLIQASLSELFQSRTTFVIAHRLSTVTHADLIVAMEGGEIREVGTHEALMERRGFYYEMVERQRQSFGVSSDGAGDAAPVATGRL